MDSTVTLAAIAVAILVFFVGVAIAYVVFRMLKKSFKMALRLAMAAGLLLAIFAGAMAVVYFNSGEEKKSTKPAATKKR